MIEGTSPTDPEAVRRAYAQGGRNVGPTATSEPVRGSTPNPGTGPASGPLYTLDEIWQAKRQGTATLFGAFAAVQALRQFDGLLITNQEIRSLLEHPEPPSKRAVFEGETWHIE
jgi:hypothetical protein